MAKLLLFRHSTKDGPNNEIGPKGFALAIAQGIWLREAFPLRNSFHPVRLFHGPLVRTRQTLIALTAPAAIFPASVHVIPEFGDDQLFKMITSPTQFRTLAATMGNFRALLQVHELDNVKEWALLCQKGLRDTFAQLNLGDFGIAVAHSPTIELAMWAEKGFPEDLPDEYAQIEEMAGLDLFSAEAPYISINSKIPAPALA